MTLRTLIPLAILALVFTGCKNEQKAQRTIPADAATEGDSCCGAETKSATDAKDSCCGDEAKTAAGDSCCAGEAKPEAGTADQ
jgi:hypothetical protein